MFTLTSSGGGSWFHTWKNHPSVSSLTDARTAEKYVLAVRSTDIKTMKKMFKKKMVGINSEFWFEEDMEKMTALHYAAKLGNLEMVKELVAVACELNMKTHLDGSTAIHLACECANNPGVIELVHELLINGANPNLCDRYEKTPLITVSEQGQLELVKMLLHFGAQANHMSVKEEYPVSLQSILNQDHIPDVFKKDMCDGFVGNNALIQACREHHVLVAKELVSSGCTVDCQNGAGNSPLHTACRSESRRFYMDEDGQSRLPVTGNLEIVEYLVEQGSDLDLTNAQGDTSLICAIKGILEIAQWRVPVDEAIIEWKNFCDIAVYLIMAGCDVVHQNKEGDTAMTILLKCGTVIATCDSQSLLSKYCRCATLLLTAGCTMSTKDLALIQEWRGFPWSTAFLTLLEAGTKPPATLKQLCRWRLRRYLKKPLHGSTRLLSLPGSLVHYLNLEILD